MNRTDGDKLLHLYVCRLKSQISLASRLGTKKVHCTADQVDIKIRKYWLAYSLNGVVCFRDSKVHGLQS